MLAAVPQSVKVRVCWMEYPFPQGGGAQLPLGEHRYLLYEGRVDNVWSDAPGVPCYEEAHLRRGGFCREGCVVAFAAGVLLVTGDDLRVHTLDPKFCRVLCSVLVQPVQPQE